MTLMFGDLFTANIQQYMGNRLSFIHQVIPLLVSILTAMIVISFSYTVLRRFGQISAAQAIQGGISSPSHKNKFLCTSRKTDSSQSILVWFERSILANKDVFNNYLYYCALYILMLMPIQLWYTLQSPDFVTYLGSGKVTFELIFGRETI